MKRLARSFPSSTVPGRRYQANVSIDCQCPGYFARRHCRHVRELTNELVPPVPEKPKKEYRAPNERRRRRHVTLPGACPECAGTTASRNHDAKQWVCFHCSAPMPEVKVALK